MGNSTNAENWAARERLRSVELRLWWRGHVGRKELMEFFGISAAQATSDLQRYFELNGGACFYNTKTKRYEAVPEMGCVRHEPVLEEGLQLVFGEVVDLRWERSAVRGAGKLGVVNLPTRGALCSVERAVVLAAAGRRSLRVKYASVRSGRSRWRVIFPGSFGWDGRRWHVRAFCEENEDWRDFVIGRIEEAEWPGAVVAPPADVAWERWSVVKLQINPELDAVRRRALRLDYGMKGESLEIRVREAMRPYFLAEMFLVEESGVDAPRHFVLKK